MSPVKDRTFALRRTWSVPVMAVGVVALLFFVVPGGLAGATPSPGASDSTPTWAYGSVATTDFQGTSASGVPYVGNATYGFTELVSQTNLSASEFELTIDRTMGAWFAVEYCYPTCNAPRYYADLAVHAFETADATATITNAGLVYEGATPTPAFALVNATSIETANVSESTHSYLPGTDLVPVARAASLAAQVDASASVEFGSPLGLFPTNLTTSTSWNSSATFLAEANASYAYHASHVAPLANWNLSGHGAFPVAGVGNVSVQGSYSTSDAIEVGGVRFPEVRLAVIGPFALRDGVVLVPSVADLFHGNSQPWSANASGEALAGMTFLDVRPSVAGHFGLGASAWTYNSNSLEPVSVVPGAANPTELSGQQAPDTSPQTVVQGEPESPSQAASTQGCLVTGSGCPSGSGTSPVLHGLVGLVTVGVLVVLVVALAVVIGERRKIPPPTYPNAALYPPGDVGRARSARGPDPPANPPPEDDPLGNLW